MDQAPTISTEHASGIVSKTFQRIRNAVRYPHLVPLWISWQAQGGAKKDPALRMFDMSFSSFPHFNAFVGASHYRSPERELRLFDNYVTGAKTVFDIGANFGVLAGLFAQRASEARIFAFEPHPETFETLKKNLEQNDVSNVATHQLAMGDSTGTVVFTSHGSPASNRIAEDPSLYPTIEVAMTTLDQFAEEHGVPEIDFLKIDVEGAELLVLKGACRMLGSGHVRAGMIELCAGTLVRFGATVDDLLDRLGAYATTCSRSGRKGVLGQLLPRESPIPIS